MELLQVAATSFVDELLLEEYKDQISISLVTYSAGVSAGPGIYNALNTEPDTIAFVLNPDGTMTFDDDPLTFDEADIDEFEEEQLLLDPDFNINSIKTYTNPARCIIFEDADFETTALDTDRVYRQVPRLSYNDYTTAYDYTRCPEEDHQDIIPLTQDAQLLKDTIADLVPTLTTSIHLGMKWGVALVDPSMRDHLVNVPGVDPAFAGTRPADYIDANSAVDTAKFVILMTDGQNVRGPRRRESLYDDPFWRAAFTEFPYRYWKDKINNDPDAIAPFIHPDGTQVFISGGNQGNPLNIIEYPNSTSDQNVWLQETCTAAKDEDITVFTIAMGSTTTGETQMKNCATDSVNDDYYFETEGAALVDIFTTIASQIKELRLNL
jgi:hypothetical protein